MNNGSNSQARLQRGHFTLKSSGRCIVGIYNNRNPTWRRSATADIHNVVLTSFTILKFTHVAGCQVRFGNCFSLPAKAAYPKGWAPCPTVWI